MEFLSATFDNYFSPGELNAMESWIIDPFKFNVDKLPDDESYKEDLIDLKESPNLKMEFESMVLQNFLKCWTGNIFKVVRKSTQSSPSFPDYLSVRSRVFSPGLLKE